MLLRNLHLSIDEDSVQIPSEGGNELDDEAILEGLTFLCIYIEVLKSHFKLLLLNLIHQSI